MDSLFESFHDACSVGSGPILATLLRPLPSPEDPSRPRKILQSSNFASIHSDVRYGLLTSKRANLALSKSEETGWIDVFVAYWRVLAEIHPPGIATQNDWGAVYESWKDVANALIKGYSNHGFGAWTLPCLYVAGRYLRIFAIKADQTGNGKGSITFDDPTQEDIANEFGKNNKLEDAARVINRMFTLCISDR